MLKGQDFLGSIREKLAERKQLPFELTQAQENSLNESSGQRASLSYEPPSRWDGEAEDSRGLSCHDAACCWEASSLDEPNGDVLAEQHKELAWSPTYYTALLTGGLKAAEKREALEEINSEQIN